MPWVHLQDGVRISIHAPPRGATSCSRGRTSRRSYFNSRPSARGDLSTKCSRPDSLNFNSRPSARGDQAVRGLTPVSDISIHAPPRGATQRARHGVSNLVISIHAPPRGATCACRVVRGMTIFQFTPLREGRLGAITAVRDGEHFNSRPSARGDRARRA